MKAIHNPDTHAHALLAPFSRLLEAAQNDNAPLVVLGAFAVFIAEPLWIIFLALLFVLNGYDYLLKQVVIRRNGIKYRGDTALLGAISKMTAIVMLFALRILEWGLGQTLFDLKGWGTVVVAGFFILHEMGSILEKEKALGGGVHRVLLPVIQALRKRVGGQLGIEDRIEDTPKDGDAP